MKHLVTAITFCLMSLTVSANHDGRFELGLGLGTSDAISGSDLKKSTDQGNSNHFWLGYGLTENWGAELNYDVFDLDAVPTKHNLIGLSAIYRFKPNSFIHPVVKFGLAGAESKNSIDEKKNSLAAKLAGGIEADFNYFSLGFLLNYFFIEKAGSTDAYKEAQVLAPALTLTFHTGKQNDTIAEQPKKSAPEAVTQMVDSDGDGIKDEDDKCPSTSKDLKVNSIGCSEKENAAVKLNIDFMSGSSSVKNSSVSEISAFADFMKKFPETNVEIIGHTDNAGTETGNLKLSQARADAVKTELVRQGISETRVKSVGKGSSVPIADNKTATGRSQNRRVVAEISVEIDKRK